MKDPLVSILCVTYNHGEFIRSCLDSLVSQKCDFHFEILIHDDASTDGTQAVITEFQEKYSEVVKPILQTENQWSKKAGGINLRFNYPRAKGKYIALCDGDDYWIGEDRLQKQISFLENHPQFNLVCGGYNSIQNGEETPIIKTRLVSSENEDDQGFRFSLGELLKYWFIKPSTAVFRNFTEKVDVLENYEFFCDVHLFYHLLKTKDAYYSKEVLAGYNRHSGGVYSGKSAKELLPIHYCIFKEIYEQDKNEFVREKYLEISYQLINLRSSGLLSSRSFQTSELKNKNFGVRTIYNEIKPILKTREEHKKLYKCFIPTQLKFFKSKLYKSFVRS